MIRPALVALLLLVACSSPDPRPREPQPLPPPPPAPSAPEVPAVAAPAADERDPTPEELPLAEDFAAEAERQVTRKNMKSELDAIENELNAEK